MAFKIYSTRFYFVIISMSNDRHVSSNVSTILVPKGLLSFHGKNWSSFISIGTRSKNESIPLEEERRNLALSLTLG